MYVPWSVVVWDSAFTFPLLVLRIHFYFTEGLPAVIARLCITTACSNVVILPALRADPLAFFTAELLHRKGQQDMLPQHIFQLNSSAFIKTELSITLIKRHFARSLVAGH